MAVDMYFLLPSKKKYVKYLECTFALTNKGDFIDLNV